MYGLPPDVDLSFLQELVLLQVAVGEFQTQLHFDGDTTISVEGAVTIDGARHMGAEAGAKLAMYVGRSLERVERGSHPCDLVLIFRGEASSTVTIHDSNAEYESYTIESPRGIIVV